MCEPDLILMQPPFNRVSWANWDSVGFFGRGPNGKHFPLFFVMLKHGLKASLISPGAIREIGCFPFPIQERERECVCVFLRFYFEKP
jgi:hypothetical protein